MINIIKKLLYSYIGLVAIAFMALGTYAFISELTIPSSPVMIKSVKLAASVYSQGDPLQLEVVGSIVRAHCDVYVDRAIARVGDGAVVWQEISPVYRDVPMQPDAKPTIVAIQIPILPVGEYSYRAVVHAVCDGTSFTRPSPLLTFSVQKRALSH